MLKHCIAGVSIAALALGLAASSAFAADKPVYGVLMKTLSNPFWGAMEKGVDDGAKKAGRRHLPAGGRVRPGGRAAAQRLQHDAAEEAGGDDHRGDQFDHPAALPQAGQRDEDPGRRPRQQPRSRRSPRRPASTSPSTSARTTRRRARRAPTISSACSARTPRGRCW